MRLGHIILTFVKAAVVVNSSLYLSLTRAGKWLRKKTYLSFIVIYRKRSDREMGHNFLT